MINWHEILGNVAYNLFIYFLMVISYSFSKNWFKDRYNPSFIGKIYCVLGVLVGSAIAAILLTNYSLNNPQFYTLILTLWVPGIYGMLKGVKMAKKPLDDTSIINEP